MARKSDFPDWKWLLNHVVVPGLLVFLGGVVLPGLAFECNIGQQKLIFFQNQVVRLESQIRTGEEKCGRFEPELNRLKDIRVSINSALRLGTEDFATAHNLLRQAQDLGIDMNNRGCSEFRFPKETFPSIF